MQPDLTVEIVGTHHTHDDLYRAALDHANAQADAVTPRPVTIRMTTAEGVTEYRDIKGVVGDSWVEIADSEFAAWAVTAKKGIREHRLVVFPHHSDSLERATAWAAGFAAVLCEAGIRATIHVGVD